MKNEVINALESYIYRVFSRFRLLPSVFPCWLGVRKTPVSGNDSSPVSERSRTAVPVRLQHSGRRCRHSGRLSGICVPPTVNYLQFLATGSTHFTAVGPFQLPAPQSETLSRISSGIRPSVQTVADVCLQRTCSLDTSAFSTLEVLDDNRAL